MAYRLKLDKITEISFVDKGASGDGVDRARVVFAKRDGEPDPPPPHVPSETWLDRFMKRIRKQEDTEPMPAILNNPALQAFVEGLPPEKAAELVQLLSAKADGEDDPKPEPPKPEDEAMPPGVEKVLKAMQEQQEALAKANEDLRGDLKQALETVSKLRDERDVSEYRKRAEGLAYLPGSVDETADVLKAAASLPEKQRDAIAKMLDAANAMVKSTRLFEGAGSSMHDDGDDSPEALLRQKAKELHELGKAETLQKAYVMARRQNQDLVRKALKEQNDGR